MAFGDTVQSLTDGGATIFQLDFAIATPTTGNPLTIAVFGQGAGGGTFTLNAGASEGFVEWFRETNPDSALGTAYLVVYRKISTGDETGHLEWSDFNTGVGIYVEHAADGNTVSHDVADGILQTDTGSTMASDNVDPTDGERAIELGIFGRIKGAGTGSSFSAGTIKGSSTGVTEDGDYGPAFYAVTIQKKVEASVASGNYFSGVTCADNISGNDTGVAAIAIWKGGAGGGDTLFAQSVM